MYRALYAHKSKLPKYLSFEAGDRFTLVDTSKSDQWFLAQNGLGEIGFVPFNYIKKIEATIEQQVKFIDGAMEAIHLQATNVGGQYTHEQRVIMKKLVKHRSEVIKNAAASDPKSSSRRRPAPAPPVDRSASVDAARAGRASNLAAVGRSATVAADSGHDVDKGESVEHRRDQSKQTKKSGSSKHNVVPSGGRSKSSDDPRRASAHSEVVRNETSYDDNVKKSKSVTSSIGQAPSLVSSFSSNTSDLTTTDSASKWSDEGVYYVDESYCLEQAEPKTLDDKNIPSSVETKPQPHYENNTDLEKPSDFHNYQDTIEENTDYADRGPESQIELDANAETSNANSDQEDMPPPPPSFNSVDDTYESTPSSASATNDIDLPVEDLPPPPPEVYADIEDGQLEADDTLPPAPPDLTADEELLKMDEMYVSLNSDILELCGRKPMEECCCEDFQPKFDSVGKFFAHNALTLPSERSVKVGKKERHESKQAAHVFSSLLKPQDDPEKVHKQHELLEVAQAHCVQVTHADCEEMIGEFRKGTNLSHEESHWALLTAMNLLAAKVPHIKPSLEVVGMRLNMAHECRSTGKDYQCEDTRTLDRLTSELAAVTNDAQQRGHYLRDDLDSIIDIITNLSETLSNAKHCVSVSAIQKDNYNLVEIIAKYYQMETRWVIHSCLLQLIETICRLNPQAIQEFLYSELPQEMVAEMQQHHNDDSRLLQVAKTLGIIFMKGQPSPHKLSLTMDIHFFIWLLGMIENMAELNRLNDVDALLALVCAYHLQHEEDSQNPVTEALKLAHGHSLLASALVFLSKHDDPTKLLDSGIEPKVNSVILLLTNLFDNPDTSDLLYTNDVEALIGIFEEFLRDLNRDEPLRVQMLHLLENFMRNYPDTVSMRGPLCSRLGHLLLNIREEKSKCGEMAGQILDDNTIVFDEL